MGTAPLRSDAVLDRLLQMHPKLIDLTLDRVFRLLDRLGNPHKALPPVIHVAGTNGKGSVIAYLEACLTAAGYSVHVATSPHLVRFAERIKLAGVEIEEDALSVLLEECETVNCGDPITYFEITTVAALLAFSRVPADVVLLEVGLGGRLDATNVIARPALTVITPIGLDHQEFLGDSLAEIAAEKAGIIKSNVLCVAAGQQPEAEAVVRARAEALGAPLLWQGRDFSARAEDGMFRYAGPGGPRTLTLPALAGAHQVDNAGQAIACLDALSEFAVADDALAKGMARVRWPARLQRLTTGRLAQLLPQGWELWLDGGHNPQAARAVSAFVGRWRDTPVHGIAGMLNTKDPAGFFGAFSGLLADVHTVAIPGEKNSLTAAALAASVRQAGLIAIESQGAEAALKAIVAAAPPGPARVLILGSLYLAGSVLADND
jgi:dihydrofolate synthase/folylpolyglutamate synthase